MKKIVLIIASVFVSGITIAQQLPQYSQFFLNKTLYNPGATGTEEFWEAQAINRLQWVGMTDAPRTHLFTANGPISGYKMGLGGSVFTDITGPTRRTGFSFNYSYKLQVTKTIKLGMGLSFGGLQYTIDGSQITLKNPDDVALNNQKQSSFVPDAGIGFHLYSDDFYFGFSIPQVLGNRVNFFDEYRSEGSTLARHLFIYGGYKFQLNDDFVVEPAILAKYVQPAPMSIEGNLRVIYQDFVWAGLSYRMNDAVSVMAGINVNESLIFAYSFDVTTSNIRTVSSGSHEIMFAIRFKHHESVVNETK